MFRSLLIALTTVVLSACAPLYDEAQLAALRAVDDGAVLIDVRSAEEFDGGHLDGAVNIPHTEIVAGVAARGLSPDTAIVVYCRSGNRSGMAEAALKEAGFTAVRNGGSLEALTAAQADRAG